MNVPLPDGYHSSGGRRHPVLYLLHGGLQDFITFDAAGVRAQAGIGFTAYDAAAVARSSSTA